MAREGARLGVIASSTLSDVTSRVDSLLVQSNLSLANRTVTVSCDGTPGMCAQTGDGLEVQVDYQHTFVVLGPVLDLMCAGCGTGYGTVTLSSRSVMRRE